MRLYAFLLLAGAALCARAASIPVAETEKIIIDIVPDNLDKLPENTSSEQELIDQTNTIKDVDNKLRTKPEGIPVEVIVENVQPALIAGNEEEEEINRPVPDLRNPGPPQRQEHETQNPEYYASEQQTVALFKQSIQDAQNVLRKGFQGVTDGIQSVVASNEPIQTLQQSIQSLRDGFTAQIIKVNETIQSYLNTESIDKPAAEKTKASFHQIEQGLFKLRNDFNREVSVFTSGVEMAAALKADNETPAESSGSTSASASPTPAPGPINSLVQVVSSWQSSMNDALQSLSDRFNNFTSQFGQPATPSAVAPAEVQSDSQVTSGPAPVAPTNFINQGIQSFQNFIQGSGQPGSGSGPLANLLNNINGFFTFTTPKPAESQVSQGTQPASSGQTAPATKPEDKPEAQANPAKPAEGAGTHAQAAAVTPAGPIRKILQNNPITLGIAGAVQRLQNINNPEKPRDEKTQAQVINEEKIDSERKKGGGPNSGDNNDSSNSGDRVEQTEEVKEEIEKISEVEKVPEVQKAEEKTEEVVNKTE